MQRAIGVERVQRLKWCKECKGVSFLHLYNLPLRSLCLCALYIFCILYVLPLLDFRPVFVLWPLYLYLLQLCLDFVPLHLDFVLLDPAFVPLCSLHPILVLHLWSLHPTLHISTCCTFTGFLCAHDTLPLWLLCLYTLCTCLWTICSFAPFALFIHLHPTFATFVPFTPFVPFLCIPSFYSLYLSTSLFDLSLWFWALAPFVPLHTFAPCLCTFCTFTSFATCFVILLLHSLHPLWHTFVVCHCTLCIFAPTFMSFAPWLCTFCALTLYPVHLSTLVPCIPTVNFLPFPPFLPLYTIPLCLHILSQGVEMSSPSQTKGI